MDQLVVYTFPANKPWKLDTSNKDCITYMPSSPYVTDEIKEKLLKMHPKIAELFEQGHTVGVKNPALIAMEGEEVREIDYIVMKSCSRRITIFWPDLPDGEQPAIKRKSKALKPTVKVFVVESKIKKNPKKTVIKKKEKNNKSSQKGNKNKNMEIVDEKVEERKEETTEKTIEKKINENEEVKQLTMKKQLPTDKGNANSQKLAPAMKINNTAVKRKIEKKPIEEVHYDFTWQYLEAARQCLENN